MVYLWIIIRIRYKSFSNKSMHRIHMFSKMNSIITFSVLIIRF